MHGREQDRRSIGEPKAEAVQAELECFEARRRPRIDQRDTSGVTHDRGGDDAGTASEFQVYPAKAGCKNGHAGRGIILTTLKSQIPRSKSQIPMFGSWFGIWGLGFGIWDFYMIQLQAQTLLAAVARLVSEE